MENNKFKYSDKFKKTLLDIDSEVSREVISKENGESINIADLTDNKKMVKLRFEKHKQEVKFGKFIKKIIPNINAKDLEKFVNEFKSSQFKPYFEEIRGEEIKEYYKEKNYVDNYENNCSLYESCMNDMHESTFDIYTKNDDNFRLLILRGEDSKILGRSLIVSKVESLDGYTDMEVMLTPYVSYQSLHTKFLKYAEDNNIFYVDSIYGDIKVKLDNIEFKNYPYVDEFQKIVGNYLCASNFDYTNIEICGIKLVDGIGYKSLSLTNGKYEHNRGNGYYKSISDFNNGKKSYTFNSNILSRCDYTRSRFLKDDIVKSKSKIYRTINKHLLDNRIELDITEFKKDIKLYSLLFKLESKFKNNMVFSSYNHGWIDFDYNCDNELSFEQNYKVIINRKSLEITFKIGDNYYIFKFKSKPSGLTVKVYKCNVKSTGFGKLATKGDIILTESKPLSNINDLCNKISTYIKEVKRIDRLPYNKKRYDFEK